MRIATRPCFPAAEQVCLCGGPGRSHLPGITSWNSEHIFLHQPCPPWGLGLACMALTGSTVGWIGFYGQV